MVSVINADIVLLTEANGRESVLPAGQAGGRRAEDGESL